MNKVILHTNNYVKKVEPITDLFSWESVLESNFPQLPSECIELNDTLVDRYFGEEDRAFMHQATLGRKYGKVFCAYATHDYDEDASGMYVTLSTSLDNGLTWSNEVIVPQFSDMAVSGTYPSQWTYPSLFLDLPSGFYLLCNSVDGLSELINYSPLGTSVIKINEDGTLGDLLWVNNGISSSSRVVPTPISGYPSYSFASEDLINEVTSYISQKMYRPKILFGWSEVWETQEDWIFDGSNLREPTEITPYNYPKNQSLKFWKPAFVNYNIIQDTDDNSTQVLSDIPNGAGAPVRRLYNYSPEIIVSVGASKLSNRTELMLFIARKDNNTGVYKISNGDVYSVTAITKSAPIYPGFNKVGGEQLPFIQRYGKDKLDIAFSVSKEEIYYKRVDVSKLI